MVHREEDIIQWASDRGIIANGKAKTQGLKTLEEVTELLVALEAGDRAGIRDGIGDSFVTLVNVAALSNLDMHECIEAAWNEIKDRKGYLNSEGVFVKEL